jgi:hypothetical protein
VVGAEGAGPRGNEGSGRRGELTFDHCPFCLWQAGAPALPSQPAATWFSPGRLELALDQSVDSPRARVAWDPARPRAPPAVS